MKCRHCYVVGAEGGGEMSGGQVVAALEKLARAGVLFLTFTGGEPLARDDFFEIAERARELNYSVRVFTNGTLIDRAAADRLAALNLFEVGVSVYGVREETHEAITGVAGSFRKTMASLRLLSERGVRLALKTVIMKPNFGEYGGLIELAGKFGARYVFDPTVFPRDDGDKAPLALRLDDGQLETTLKDKRFYPRGEGEVERAAPGAPAVCRGPVCNLSFISLGVSPEGDVYPCIQLKRPVGNINSDSMDLINTQYCINVPNITTVLADTCYNCKLRDNCTRCPGLAELEDGDINGKSEWACRIARIREKANRE